MRFAILAFGKLKTPGLREAADHYLRAIRTWAEVEEIELKPLAVPDKSPSTRTRIQEKEAESLEEKISSRLSSRAAIFLLDEGGKALATTGWAGMIRDWEDRGIQEIALCIGSSLGFAERIRKRAQGRLSLGPQTLPHELARVVLEEQLFRALSVIHGHPYHNEGS